MDLLDRLLLHDAWTTDRLLEICQRLPDDALDRDLGIGRGTLRATLEHVVRNVEAWGDPMAGRPTRARGGSDPEQLRERLAAASADLLATARAIADRGAWDETWIDPADDPPVPRTYGGTIAHVATHGMHHRAQALFMLRRLGVEGLPEGDVLSWEAHARGDG